MNLRSTTRNFPVTLLIFLLLIGGTACVKFHPQPSTSAEFHQRLKTQAQGGIEVSAAVLGKKESQTYFGVKLAKKHVQAVYLKIKNHEKKPYWLMPISIDPNYYSANEVAYRHRTGRSGEVQMEMNEFFEKQQIPLLIQPGETAEGFVYTNVDFGSKEFSVDLLGKGELKRFPFVVPVPGLSADYQEVDFAKLYPPAELREVSLEELRQALQAYPCCTTRENDDVHAGDAVNLVIVGDMDDLLTAFVRQGWRETAVQDKHSSLKSVKSLLFHSPYANAPMSKLYLFGRHQDVAFQKPRRSIHQRNHLRLWMTPLRFEGKPIWIGTVSRDIGIRFTKKAFLFITHKIDSDIDEARSYLVQDMMVSDSVDRIGLVEGVGARSIAEPHKNYMGDTWYTDGLRAVIFIADEPTPLLKTKALHWARPDAHGLGHLEEVVGAKPVSKSQ